MLYNIFLVSSMVMFASTLVLHKRPRVRSIVQLTYITMLTPVLIIHLMS